MESITDGDLTLHIAGPTGDISLFTTITTFGTPMDVTLQELAVELFFPTDDRSATLLKDLAAAAGMATAPSR